MQKTTLTTIYNRDLNRLLTEIQQYNNEADLWKVNGQIKNSAGNLCLHLIGNLNLYIGKVLGNSNYIRTRELEFSCKNIPGTELIKKIEETIETINLSLDNLDEKLLESEYPLLVFDEMTSTEFLLVHLATHLNYHLGQINYHRRMINNDTK
ncbi:MAG: DUF1572 family protein [Ferruginibacter sp.]